MTVETDIIVRKEASIERTSCDTSDNVCGDL